jgi:hypothetical protein
MTTAILPTIQEGRVAGAGQAAVFVVVTGLVGVGDVLFALYM